MFATSHNQWHLVLYSSDGCLEEEHVAGNKSWQGASETAYNNCFHYYLHV